MYYDRQRATSKWWQDDMVFVRGFLLNKSKSDSLRKKKKIQIFNVKSYLNGWKQITINLSFNSMVIFYYKNMNHHFIDSKKWKLDCILKLQFSIALLRYDSKLKWKSIYLELLFSQSWLLLLKIQKKSNCKVLCPN